MSHLLLASLGGFYEEHKDLIISIIIGAVAGYIAQAIVPGRGFGLLATILIGMIGGYIGEVFLGKYIHLTHDEFFDGMICAILGSMVLVIVINLLMGRQKEGIGEKDTYEWENE